MSNCCWEPIHGFNRPGEFERFCNRIDSQVEAGMVEKLPKEAIKCEMYPGLQEIWYRCRETGAVWRLVWPDFPFRGWWDDVKS